MFAAPLIWLLLPGVALLPFKLGRRLQLPVAVGISFLVTSAFALILVFLGCFKPWLLTIVLLGFIPVGLVRKSFHRIAIKDWLPLLAFIPIAAAGMFWHGEPYQGACDAGVYVAAAHHLNASGRYCWTQEEILPTDPAARALSIRTTPYQFPWKETWPGIILMGNRAVPQFFPLFPVWMALFMSAFGLPGILLTNAVFFVLGMMMLALLARLFLPAPFAWIAPLMMALNPGVFYFLRYPSAEIFLAFILTGFAAFLVQGLYLRGELHLEMAGCLLAAGLATKYLAWFLLAPLAVVWVIHREKRWFAKWFGLFFLGYGLFPALCLALYNYPHWMNHFLPRERLLEGAGLLAALACLWFASESDWVRRRAAAMVGILFTLLILVFLFVLPHSIERGEENALPELIWYIGWGWFILGFIGCWVGLFRKKRGAGPVLVLFLLMLMASLGGTSDNPLHPFAFRRHIPVLLPLMACLSAMAVYWFRRIGRAGLTAGLLLCLLPPLAMNLPLLIVREGRGFEALSDALQRGISTGHALDDMEGFGSQVQLMGGNAVFPLHLDSADGLAAFQKFALRGGGLRFLSSQVLAFPGTTIGGGAIEVLRPERNQRPSIIETQNIVVRQYRIALEDVRAEAGIIMDGRSDFGRIAGFWNAEKDGERPFRWSGPWCHFVLQTRDRLALTMDSSGNPEHPLPFRIYCGKELLAEDFARPGWRTYSWKLPAKFRNSMVVFSLVTHTFQPLPDTRVLGLKISEIHAHGA